MPIIDNKHTNSDTTRDAEEKRKRKRNIASTGAK